MTIKQLLYVSEMTSNVSSSCVADIVRVARARNLNLGVTGVLIFDGWRFFQYLESEEGHIEELMSSISQDPRHQKLTILYQTTLLGLRRFPRWNMGYALIEQEEALNDISRKQGEDALDSLLALIPNFDLDP